MIVQTTRIRRDGGVRYLARHLLDKVDENERIDVLSGDRQALYDAHALASAKGCRYSVRHLSVSPERAMSPVQLSAFIRAIDDEFGIGGDRPRLVVRHVKEGRAHFHVAVAEVDPTTFRVLDCRNDFARLEAVARQYEADRGETVQPARAERRHRRTEGFSDVARKRAERENQGFDRTELKAAFAQGRAAFNVELDRQRLVIANGEQGHILTTTGGAFVAAASRAVGVRRAEFQNFMKTEFAHEQFIGSQHGRPEHRLEDGDVCSAPLASSLVARNAGTARPARSNATGAAPDLGHAATTSSGPEILRRSARPVGASVASGRRREQLELHRIGKMDLDDLLRRARDLAAWMTSLFEPQTARLARQIADVRKRKSFPPDEPSQASIPSHSYLRRPHQ
ncbi:hypothetical protein [Rhizobium sp. Leaf371]|uniref:relaxase/mobilization nuclease domain-containing protein n=1 Tax=Rhizobium sp. Leaf371 TaxID=1736355 RepID=UPI0012E8ACD6|nr:hypothetical protein [Rhizobium sp. Leaf371]